MRSVIAGWSDGFGTCRMGGSLPRLDLAGFSALYGTNATKAGIPYTCLVRSRMPYLNAYVPAGTLGLGQAVLACIAWRPARILIGAGEVGSMLELCGVKASGNAIYVGLQSATSLPVRGVVGEGVVRELVRRGKMRVCPSLIGRDSGRPTTVVWANINESEKIGGPVHLGGSEGAVVNYVATSICVIVLVLEARCRGWICVSLVAVGMFLNALMGFLLRVQTFELPSVRHVSCVPPGDSVIVLKDEPDVFCVLRGTETAIQKLLQKEVTLNAGWVKRLPLFLVSVAFMIYAAAVVLVFPRMEPSAQLMFLIVVCVGSITDLIKGSYNQKRGMAEEAMVMYGIEVVDAKKFRNRTASLACVAAGSTKLDTLKAAGLCPTTGPVWENWWNALRILDGEAIDRSEIQQKLPDIRGAPVQGVDGELWKTLQADMWEGRQHATSRTS